MSSMTPPHENVIAKASESVATLVACISSLREEINGANDRADRIETEGKALVTNAIAKIEDLNARIRELEIQSARHLSELRQSRALVDSASRELEDAAAEKSSLEAAVIQANIEIAALTERLDSSVQRRENDELRAQMLADGQRFHALLDDALAENQRLSDSMRQLRLTLRNK